MGVIPMETVDSFLSRGYPHHTTALYVYCDKCGSFNIKHSLSLRQCLLITGGSALAFFAFHVLKNSWFLFLCALIFIGMTIINFWGLSYYWCRKCWKFTTIRYNTRPLNTKFVIDVPDKLIQKIYFDYWPDMCDLNEYLSPPEDLNKRNNK
jgi:hypothetical protein